jgi:hypothetical protein
MAPHTLALFGTPHIWPIDELQGGVSEHELVDKTAEYLCKWVFDDVQKARMAASDFIRFCTGRAWVFTDTGTTREGENLFQFTHRTFLEYFTACHLVSVNPTPEALMEALQTRVTNGEWDVVAQLSLQTQSKQVQGAADKLLAQLLQITHLGQTEAWNRLSFAERSLEFLVPSPKMRREIAQAALDFWMRAAQHDAGSKVPASATSRRQAVEHVGNLLRATAENRDTLADEVKSFLVLRVHSDDEATAKIAADLGLSLSGALHSVENRGQVSKEVYSFWNGISEQIIAITRDRILKLGQTDRGIRLRCYWHRLAGLTEAVVDFGPSFLVVGARSVALGNVWFSPAGYSLLSYVLGYGWYGVRNRAEREERAQELAGISEVLLRTPTPWVDGYGEYWGSWHDINVERRGVSIPLSPDATFSVLSILGMELEKYEARKAEDVKTLCDRIPGHLGSVLLGRASGEKREKALQTLDSLGLGSAQCDFLRRWINREINLVSLRGRGRGDEDQTHRGQERLKRTKIKER